MLCSRELVWLDKICPRCASPLTIDLGDSQESLAVASDDDACSTCRGDSTWCLDGAAAAVEYSGPTRRLVLSHKVSADRGSRRFLVQLLSRAKRELRISAEVPWLVASVPQHPFKHLWRGRDPCQELARDFAKEEGLRYRSLIHKGRWTAAQVELSRSERKRNLRRSFRVLRKLRGQPVLLVDDVMTTGTTAKECARALRRAGAGLVAVLCAARS